MATYSRTRLPMQILSIIVIFTLLMPPGLVLATPVSAETTTAVSQEKSVAAALVASVGAWLRQPIWIATRLFHNSDPMPAMLESPLPTPTPSAEPKPNPEIQNPSNLPDLTLSPKGKTTLGPKGGWLVAGDKMVTLSFPKGSVDTSIDLRLEITKTMDAKPEDEHVRWLTLGLEPVDASRKVEGHLRFNHPVTLTFDLSDFPGWLEPYVVHEVDAEKGQWEILPSEFDEATQRLTVALTSFSDVGVSGAMEFPDDGSHYLMTNAPDVSTFSGAVSYQYDFQLPPGRNGLGPNLSLSYNSGSLNGTMGTVQGNYVGLGWSLDGLVSVVRVIKSRPWEGYNSTRWDYRNEYRLTIDGNGYILLGGDKVGTNGGCRYYVENAPGLHVMRYTDPGDQNQFCGYGPYSVSDVTNYSKEFWVVRTLDGTTHYLGTTTNSEQLAYMRHYNPDSYNGNTPTLDTYYTGVCSGEWCHFNGYAGEGQNHIAYRWSVDLTEDVYGNAIFYGYDEETPQGTGWNSARYPDWIRYTGDADQSPNGAYLVDIILEERREANDNSCPTCEWHDDGESARFYRMRDKYRIDRIRICGDVTGTSCPNSNASIVEYDLDYSLVEEQWPGIEWVINTIPHETTRLAKVTKMGWNASGQKVSLPATEFDYVTLTQATNDADPVGGNYGSKLVYPRMMRVRNGFGGVVEFDFNGSNPLEHEDIYSYRVDEKRVKDGLGHTGTTVYSYGSPCYDGRRDDADSCRHDDDPDLSFALIGHDETTVTTYDYDGTVLSKQKHFFHTTTDSRQGKRQSTEVYNGSTLIQKTVMTQTMTDIAVGVSLTKFAYVSQEETTTYSGGTSETIKTNYMYDTNRQDGGQYGKLTRVYEHDETGTCRRITLYVYDANETKWVVVPQVEAVFDGNWNPKSVKHYLHDGNTDPDNQVIDIGKLTMTRVYQEIAYTKRSGITGLVHTML